MKLPEQQRADDPRAAGPQWAPSMGPREPHATLPSWLTVPGVPARSTASPIRALHRVKPGIQRPVRGVRAALLRACSLKNSLSVHSALLKYINCHGNNALIGMGAAWWPPQMRDKNQWIH